LRNDAEILWVGAEGGPEAKLVEREGLRFCAIPAAGVHGVSLPKLPRNLWKLNKGYWKSKEILRAFKPDVLLFTGGYVAIPMALAALKTQKILFVPDIEPGLALKTLANFSDRIAVTVDASRNYFRHKERIIVTGYPVRSKISKWTPAMGLEYFHFDPKLPVVLFTGGSSGARSINEAVLAIAPQLLETCQVIHLTGHLGWETVQKASQNFGPRYQAFPYLHEMGAAYAAANLVVSRSGASCLGEYPLFGLPAILIPYPYAWRYQKVNADYLVDAGAAILLEDSRLKQDLLNTIKQLLAQPLQLACMAEAMRKLSKPQAAEAISALIYEMAEV
jgi:undecaprenyldiphospho-muramoylpentapeptide beta-N-acetylglucosaminyltransferase